MKKLIYAGVSAVLVPIALVIGVVVVGGAATSAGQAAIATASAVCAYANPDPVRIAVAMEQLTHQPVDAQHWDTYSAAAGIDPAVSFESSSVEQRHQVLLHAVQTILYSTPPHFVTTPPMVWWHTRMPVDNDDTSWETDAVPGWTGTLADYIDAFVDVYATDPIVLAAGADDSGGCLPTASSVCAPPSNTGAILATIRALESGDNYTESRRSRASGHEISGASADTTRPTWRHPPCRTSEPTTMWQQCLPASVPSSGYPSRGTSDPEAQPRFVAANGPSATSPTRSTTTSRSATTRPTGCSTTPPSNCRTLVSN